MNNTIAKRLQKLEYLNEVCIHSPSLLIDTKCGIARYKFNKIGYRDNKLLIEFKLLTDSYKGNVDSHDNSLYHKSLYKKENNYSKHSIQSIVDDYNRRWKKNLTVEEYYDNFK